MSRTAPFDTNEQPRYDTKIVGGKVVLQPIEKDTGHGELGDGGEGAVDVVGSWHGTSPRQQLACAANHRLRRIDGGNAVVAPTRNSSGQLSLTAGPAVLPPIGQTDRPLPRSGDLSRTDDGEVAFRSPVTGALSGKQAKAVLEALRSHKDTDLTVEQLRSLFSRACPSLEEHETTKLLDSLRRYSGSKHGSMDPMDFKFKSVLTFIQDLANCSGTSTATSPVGARDEDRHRGSSPFGGRVAPLKMAQDPRFGELKRQLSSSEPSLINVGLRPATHSFAAKLPVPQIRKELDDDDPLNISSAIMAAGPTRTLANPEQLDNAELLRQRHDSKLLLAVERDWREAEQANMRVEQQFDLEALQQALGALDPGRTGKILVAQVLQLCKQHQLPVATQTLHHLCRRCDHSNDGNVRWVELLDFLERAQPIILSNGLNNTSPGNVAFQARQVRPKGGALKDVSDDIINIESPGEYSHLHLPKVERLKHTSSQNSLKSSSCSSLCEKDKAVEGMKRLYKALQMSADSEQGQQVDSSTARRLANMHNAVYSFGINDSRLHALLKDSVCHSPMTRSHSNYTAGSKRGLQNLESCAGLACSSSTSSLGVSPRASPHPVRIPSFVSHLCDELGLGSDDMGDIMLRSGDVTSNMDLDVE